MPSAATIISSRIKDRLSWTIIVDVAKFMVVVIGLVWLTIRGAEKLGYNWQWYRIPRYIITEQDGQWLIGPLIKGLMITLEITAISLILALAIGLVTALFRLSNSMVAQILARGYLEAIRNTPLLIQLFFIYFVLSPIVGLEAFASAVLALSLFEGAYISEMFRAGILSIDRGQWEAAHSQGLTQWQTYRYVVLPQAIRRILPMLTGQSVTLLKDSALVSTIAIYDLTMEGQVVISETFLTFEVWFTVAGIYLIFTTTMSAIARLLENRLRQD